MLTYAKRPLIEASLNYKISQDAYMSIRFERDHVSESLDLCLSFVKMESIFSKMSNVGSESRSRGWLLSSIAELNVFSKIM